MLHLRGIRGCGVKLQTAPPLKCQKYLAKAYSTFNKPPLLSQSHIKPIWSSQLLVSSRLNTLSTINAFRNQTVVSKLNFIKPHVWQTRTFFNFWSRDEDANGVAAARLKKVWTRRATDEDYENSYYDYKKRQWVKIGASDYKPWLKYRPKQIILAILLLLLGLSAFIELDLFNKNKNMDYYMRVLKAIFQEPIEMGKHIWFSFLNFLLRWIMWVAPFKHGIMSSFWRNLVVGEEDWVPFEVWIEPDLPMPYGPEFYLVLDPMLFINVKFHPIQGWTVMKRPGTDFFLEHVAKNFEITMYTDDYSLGQDAIVSRLDPDWDFVSNSLYIDMCVRRQGEYYKDVTLLKRPLNRLLLLDGKKRTCDFERNSENCIHIPYWDGDPNDTVLLDILPFLMDISDEAPDEDVDIRRIVEGIKGIDIAEYYKPLRLLAKEATDEQVARRRQEDAAVDNILKQFIIDFVQTRKEDAAMDPFMYAEDEDPEDVVKEVLPHLSPEWKKTHPDPVFQDKRKNREYYGDKSAYRLPHDPLAHALPGKSVERRFKQVDKLIGETEDDRLSPEPTTPEEQEEARIRAEYFRSRYNRMRKNYTGQQAPSPYGEFLLDENDPVEKYDPLGWPENVEEEIQKEIRDELLQEMAAMEKKETPVSSVPIKGTKPAPRDPRGVARERARRMDKKSDDNQPRQQQ